jgi:hypothetical protein
MPKANKRIKKTSRPARAQPKLSRTTVPEYEDPRDFPEEFAILLASDHLEPEYPKGCYLIVDKRLPCEKHDLVVIYPLPDAAKSGTLPAIVHLRTVLSPGIKLPVRLHPKSEVRFALHVSDAKFSKTVQTWDVHKMQAMYRVSRIADPAELAA